MFICLPGILPQHCSYISQMQDVKIDLSSSPQRKLSPLLSLPLWVVLTSIHPVFQAKILRNILTPCSPLPLCPLCHITRSGEFYFLNIFQISFLISIYTALASIWTLNSSSTTVPNFKSLKVDIFYLGFFSFLFFPTWHQLALLLASSTLILLNEYKVPECIFFLKNYFQLVWHMSQVPVGWNVWVTKTSYCLIILVNRKITGCVEGQGIR